MDGLQELVGRQKLGETKRAFQVKYPDLSAGDCERLVLTALRLSEEERDTILVAWRDAISCAVARQVLKETIRAFIAELREPEEMKGIFGIGPDRDNGRSIWDSRF